MAAVKERARGEEVSGALNPAQQIVKIVNEELVEILGGETRRLRYAKTGPTVIMLAGLQGAGKTTLAAKLALWLKEQGKSPAAGRRATCSGPTRSPSSRSTASASAYRSSRPSPATASATRSRSRGPRSRRPSARCTTSSSSTPPGRLGVDAEMMKQAADIRDAVDPDEVLFVVDAMIGQDAVTTAQAFLEGVGFDGVVLTKLDGDARGGAALSIASVTGRPVMFASAGEKMTDFDLFHPDRMASRILDMGDMLTLIEQAEKTFDSEQAAKAADKLIGQGGEFTLDDFLEQMQQVRKLGSMSKIMGMLPGMGQFRDQLENFDEREIDRIQAIIQSMTPAERANPKIIDGSRRARIAKGSGRQVSDVNSLVDRFFEARKMMMSFAKGGMPGVPGMPGMAGGGKRGKPSRRPSRRRARAAGSPATRPRPPRRRPRPKEKAAAAAANPFGAPGRRRGGDGLREGRRRPQPAEGLLEVPEVSRCHVLVVDGANVVGSPPGRVVEGPRRRGSPAARVAADRRHVVRRRRAGPRGCREGRGPGRARRAPRHRARPEATATPRSRREARAAVERGDRSPWSPRTGCCRPRSRRSARRR